MSEPTKKSEEIEQLLTNLFGDRRQAIRINICVSCKQSAHEFRNAISIKEFTISGLCQACQDSVFGVD